MKICIVIALSSVLASAASIGNLEPITDIEDLLSTVLISIIQKFHIKQSNNIFIASNKTDARHNSILSQIFAAVDRSVSTTWILHDKDYSNGNIDRMNIIVLIDSYESFRPLFTTITTTSFEYYGYYTIVLTNYDSNENYNRSLSQIFQHFWDEWALNVNILTYSGSTKQTVLLNTYFPFSTSHCREIAAIVWNSFERDHFVRTDVDIFPVKTSNLHKCPVPVLIILLRPYLFISGNNSDGSYNFEGIEYNLLLELSKQLNFKLNNSIYWPENLGLFFENGTMTGAYPMIANREYEIMVGSLAPEPVLDQLLSSTGPYADDEIKLALPYPRPYSSFETLFSPYRLTVWILLSMTVGMALVLIKLLQCKFRDCYELAVESKNPSPYFNLLSVLLTGATTYKPKGNFARFLLTVWILMCLILHNVYQGQLFRFIKLNEMTPSIKNIDQLIDSGISVKLIEENFANFLKFDPRLKKLLKFVDPNQMWEYVTDTEAYITFETQLADLAQRNHFQNILVPKPNSIKICSIGHIMYLSKRFYLKEALDSKITRMNENGLMIVWSAPYKESSQSKNLDTKIPRKLVISQILGVVEAWIGILIIASIVFIIELYSKKHLF